MIESRQNWLQSLLVPVIVVCSSLKVLSWGEKKKKKVHTNSKHANHGLCLLTPSTAPSSSFAILLHLQEINSTCHCTLLTHSYSGGPHVRWITKDYFFPITFFFFLQYLLVSGTMKHKIKFCLLLPFSSDSLVPWNTAQPLAHWMILSDLIATKINSDSCRSLSFCCPHISNFGEGRTSLKTSADVLSLTSNWKIFLKGKISN